MATLLKPRRSYLTFSLRTLFILLTALGVWLGVVVNRAREQGEAVKALEALGGSVIYDFQFVGIPSVNRSIVRDAEPAGPTWLRRLVGDEFFQHAEWVVFDLLTPNEKVLKAIPALKRLPGLAVVLLPISSSEETRQRMESAIPACTFVRMPVSAAASSGSNGTLMIAPK